MDQTETVVTDNQAQAPPEVGPNSPLWATAQRAERQSRQIQETHRRQSIAWTRPRR